MARLIDLLFIFRTDSGFGSFSLVRYPDQEANDLMNCFFDFSTDFIMCFCFVYLLLVLMLSYFLKCKLGLKESSLFIYRIMFKEHNLNLKLVNKNRSFLSFVCLFYLLSNMIIEQNVNTKLVVSHSPIYIDTIDQIYARKNIMPHFVKGHFTFEYFKNHYNDVKLKEIYERTTIECSHCIHDHNEMMPYVYNENREILSTPNHIIIIDETLMMYMKRGACNQNRLELNYQKQY